MEEEVSKGTKTVKRIKKDGVLGEVFYVFAEDNRSLRNATRAFIR